MENGVAGRRDSFTVAVDIDIHGYIHVYISDLGQPRSMISVFELLMTLLFVAALTQTSCCY